CLFVDGFKEAVPKLVINLEEQSNDRLGDLAVLESVFIGVHLWRISGRHAAPRARARMARRMGTPLCTCCRMTARELSATESMISMPRTIGPGCITMAPRSARRRRSGVSWNSAA